VRYSSPASVQTLAPPAPARMPTSRLPLMTVLLL
jgi:hypothetical protein